MWRLQAMNEVFGEVGTGWTYDIEKEWTVNGANEEVMVFVKVKVKVLRSGTWSEWVPGLGGSTLVAKEKNGMYNDDDGYKKALTDALSVAFKPFGVGADIYSGLWDGNKYSERTTEKKDKPELTEAEKKSYMLKTYGELFTRGKKIGMTILPMTPDMTIDAMKAQYAEQKKLVETQEKAGQ
jgi:recombination DNA repair RAD52 pathway protein